MADEGQQNQAEIAAFAAMFDKQRRQAAHMLGLVYDEPPSVEGDAHTDSDEQS